MLITRRAAIASVGALLASGALADDSRELLRINALDDHVLTAILDAGGWSETADDDHHGERLPAETVKDIVQAHSKQQTHETIAGVGLLALTLSVAEWGIDWGGATPPEDPAKQNWRGPPSLRGGKHLMSYTVGGIGLAHLDDGSAAEFFVALGNLVPEAKQAVQPFTGGFSFDTVRANGGICPKAGTPVALKDPFCDGSASCVGFPSSKEALADGEPYCSGRPGQKGFFTHSDPDAWNKLRHWTRVGLRRRDMQAWVMLKWLNSYWIPAYNDVMRLPHGTIREALVIARIRNSSPDAENKAMAAAKTILDPDQRVRAELDEYGRRNNTDKGRTGFMQRPWAAVRVLS